ncbi:MAG: DNA polymerase III subunit delta [Acidobacteria bacterium]|nr:DNA polymerase III subunit delta [Acidobacteriota bacterium]
MTPAQVRAAITAGSPHPIYLLESDDAPSRFELAQAFFGLVDEGLHAFNTASFHGREAGTASERETMLSAILGAARTLPMMAPRRVLLVHDADWLLTPRKSKDEDAPPAKTAGGKRPPKASTPAEDFEDYVASPEPLTTLVLDAPSLDRGRRITKLLLQKAMVVDCGTLTKPEDAARWIASRLEQDEMTMDAAAVRALLDATGLSLSRIRAEIDKLTLYVGAATAITAADVKDVVVPTEEPEGRFALADAIREGKTSAALRELNGLLDEGAPPPLVLGQIRYAVTTLRPEARARRALRRVLETDLAIKTSRGEPRYVLEALVVEICAGAPGAPAGPTRRSWA